MEVTDVLTNGMVLEEYEATLEGTFPMQDKKLEHIKDKLHVDFMWKNSKAWKKFMVKKGDLLFLRI